MGEVERINSVSVPVRDRNALMVSAEEKALNVVDKIGNLTLLTKTDITRLEKAQTFILSTYTDVPEYRPLVIKLSSVLNDMSFPTPDAKYWQCKKEAEVHFTQLVTEMYKYERAMVDIEELDYIIASSLHQIDNDNYQKVDGIDPIKMKFEIRRLRIKRDEYIFNMKLLEKSIKFRIQEVTEWAAISESMMQPNCKYSTKDYNQHIAENLYSKLEAQLKDSSGSPEDKVNYAAQLATLKRLLSEQLSKDNGNR